MTDSEAILIGLLAVGDAAHLPVRDWSGSWPSNAWVAREQYATAGVDWASNGATEAERKQAQRALEDLISAGLVQACTPGRTKRLTAKLTDQAEADARAMCALPGLRGAWLLLREVARLTNRRGGLLTDIWIPETRLSGRKPTRRVYALTEEMYVPGAYRGWLEARADAQGRVYYRVLPAGWAVLDGPGRPPTEPEPVADDPARVLYYERLAVALDRLQKGELTNAREIGVCPLPASMGGVKINEPQTT